MKNLGNYGNGGAIVTDDQELLNYARGWTDNGKSTGHAEVGTNSRMSEVDCAQLLVKSKYINDWQARRRYIARQWIDAFKDSPVHCLINETNFDTHSFHKFVIEIDNRDDVAKKLKELGEDNGIRVVGPYEIVQFINTYRILVEEGRILGWRENMPSDKDVEKSLNDLGKYVEKIRQNIPKDF
jgi:dTDP-4-amino-4,6-dideoxygalactose transaminase